MKISIKLSLASILLMLFFNALAVTETRAQGLLSEILKRMDAHQKALVSLRSKVRMERYNSQIKESDVMEGAAIYSRAGKNQVLVKIDWTKPIQESLSVINGQFIIYRSRLRMALTGKIFSAKENTKVSNPLLFLTMSKKEIKGNFNIRYLGQEIVRGETATWHLMFTPKMMTIYKSAEFWVNSDGMPIQAKVSENNNDWITVLLSDFKKNETIKISDFVINVPKGAKIIKNSAVECLCYKPDNSKDALNYWADTVFSGKVVAANGANYTLKTERVWKGVIGNEVVVRSFAAENNCAIKVMVGERYILFARKAKFEGKDVLGLMPCNFTSSILSDGGKKILRELGKGKPVKNPTVRKKRRR